MGEIEVFLTGGGFATASTCRKLDCLEAKEDEGPNADPTGY